MSKQVVSKSFQLPNGKTVTLETGKLARQAHGSVVLTMDKTMLLATVVSASSAKEDLDFLPLSTEYKERYASVGRFPGGFLKREGRPSDSEILISRLIDRAIRPLFPDDYHAETFVNVLLISGDENELPDALACLAASAALCVSDVPFHGPISEVRVSRINGKFVINPTVEENEKADIDLMVAASMENIVMVEGEMQEVSEEEMIEAIRVAHDAIKQQCQAQVDLVALMGGVEKRTYCHEKNDEELRKIVIEKGYDKTYAIAKQASDKHARAEAFHAVEEELIAELCADEVDDAKQKLVKKYFHDNVLKKAMRNMILEDKIRLDGRKTDEIRPISCEINYLPAAHGSAVFTRGETQSLTSVTLGSKMNEQLIDGALLQGTAKFLLHYNFPPFSTGDARPSRGISRREIGHGNLAHRALLKVLSKDPVLNPYTIRIVSDILESNGSSSMATVCAGCLALMDAGVKISKPVSGIAMGLITDGATGKFAVLSDILGDEDHLGDMDFKVTGTKDGITATQMDIKVDGLSYEVLAQALAQAKAGRLHILGKMTEVIAQPREDYKPFVPRIEKIIIPKEFIGAVIGPGGKIIQEMQAETKTTITIEEVDSVGVVEIFSQDKEGLEAAKKRIKQITAVPEIGEIYEGTVKTITAFGAFVEIMPRQEGLLHISEIDWARVERVEDYLKQGDVIMVKLLDIDKKTGKFKLSRRVLLPKPEPQN